MEILTPTALWAGVLACFGIFGAHALRMKSEKNYREAWGAATLGLLPAAIYWLYVMSGEPDMLKRTMLLMPAGAIIGACIFAYAGYVWNDIRAARSADVGRPLNGATMNQKIGDETVVMGDVKADVGNKSVVIGAMDDKGNVILNQPMAIGHGAQAGPGSIAIGSNAGAGLRKPE